MGMGIKPWFYIQGQGVRLFSFNLVIFLILLEGNLPGKHGLQIKPISLNKYGKVYVANDQRAQGSGEEIMQDSVEEDEIPAELEETEGNQVPKRLPENKSGEG